MAQEKASSSWLRSVPSSENPSVPLRNCPSAVISQSAATNSLSGEHPHILLERPHVQAVLEPTPADPTELNGGHWRLRYIPDTRWPHADQQRSAPSSTGVPNASIGADLTKPGLTRVVLTPRLCLLKASAGRYNQECFDEALKESCTHSVANPPSVTSPHGLTVAPQRGTYPCHTNLKPITVAPGLRSAQPFL